MSNYTIMIRSYPIDYRNKHGAEVVATANELANHTWSARQSCSLLIGGIRTRARMATDNDPKRSWAWALAVGMAATWLATGLSILLFASGAIESDLVIGLDPAMTNTRFLIGATALLVSALFLVTSTRPAVVALIALLQGLTSIGMWLSTTSAGTGIFVTLALDLAALWFIAQHGEGRGVLSHRILAGTCIALVATAFLFSNPFAPNALIVALAAFGLLLLRIDPRWTIAAAVPITIQLATVSAASWDWVPMMLLAVVTVILSLAHGTIRRLQTI